MVTRKKTVGVTGLLFLLKKFAVAEESSCHGVPPVVRGGWRRPVELLRAPCEWNYPQNLPAVAALEKSNFEYYIQDGGILPAEREHWGGPDMCGAEGGGQWRRRRQEGGLVC